MITSNRIRERGGTQAAPANPASVPFADHQNALTELTIAYEAKLNEARAGAGGSADPAIAARLAELEQSSEAAAAKIAELESELAGATAAAEKHAARVAELEALLEAATAPKAEVASTAAASAEAPADKTPPRDQPRKR